MKSKLIINIKKLISVLLSASLISYILPSDLLNNIVFAASNIYYNYTNNKSDNESNPVNDNDTNDIFIELNGAGEDDILEYKGEDTTYLGIAYGHTVSKILNETDNNSPLKEGTDYTVRYVTDENGFIHTWNIIFHKTYLEKLPKGVYNKIRVFYYILGNPEYGENEKIDPIMIVIDRLDQPDDAQLNNLKSEYTYGEDPGTIYLTGGAGEGDVSYYSFNPSVATIDENTGKLNIVRPGKFKITAIKEGDDNYYYLYVDSNEITVNPRELTISNIKIKDKFYDGTDLAEFVEDPTLNGVIDEDKDDVSLEGSPKFSNTGLGNNILIDFSDLSLSGDKSSNYRLTLPKSNIYANIISNDIDDNLSSDSDNIQLNIPSNSKDNKLAFIDLPDLVKDNKLTVVTPPDLIKSNKLKTTNPTNNIQQDMNYDSYNFDDSTQPDSDEITTDDDKLKQKIVKQEYRFTHLKAYSQNGLD